MGRKMAWFSLSSAGWTLFSHSPLLQRKGKGGGTEGGRDRRREEERKQLDRKRTKIYARDQHFCKVLQTKYFSTIRPCFEKYIHYLSYNNITIKLYEYKYVASQIWL